MKYRTSTAFRTALETRLKAAQHDGVGLPRLRKRVVFERLLARLHVVAPDAWVLKGGFDRPSSRVKDLVDLVVIAHTTTIDADRLLRAIGEIFQRRGTHPVPQAVPPPPGDWGPGWRRLVANVPADEDAGIGHATAASFLDPILENELTSGMWDPGVGKWLKGRPH